MRSTLDFCGPLSKTALFSIFVTQNMQPMLCDWTPDAYAWEQTVFYVPSCTSLFSCKRCTDAEGKKEGGGPVLATPKPGVISRWGSNRRLGGGPEPKTARCARPKGMVSTHIEDYKTVLKQSQAPGILELRFFIGSAPWIFEPWGSFLVVLVKTIDGDSCFFWCHLFPVVKRTPMF